MTVFKAFLKVLYRSKMPILLYSVILLFFGGFQMQTSENNMNFMASRPKIAMINHDETSDISENLIAYMKENCEVDTVLDTEAKQEEALFYRQIHYIITIPEHFHSDFMDGKKPQLVVKSTNDYEASLAQMQLERYLNAANALRFISESEAELVANMEAVFSETTEVTMTSKLDTAGLNKAAFYYNFVNYALLAGCIYVICLILSSFQQEPVRKRTLISSMNFAKYHRQLLLSNSLLAIALWGFYVLISLILVGDVMFSEYGRAYILNSFVFTLCALALAFLIGNLVTNKNAMNGIINVIALGSSFLCGAFVPMEYMPDFVLRIAHLLPSYWFIHANNLIKGIKTFDSAVYRELLIHMGVVLAFALLFVVLAYLIGRKRRKIA